MATADLKLDFFSKELLKALARDVFNSIFQAFTLGSSAAGLAAISGLNVISEKEARKSSDNAKPITLQELFYDQNQNPAITDQIFYIPDSEYDSVYDYDFTNYKGDDTNCTRGNYPYQRPVGWKRKAVRVIGKYEDDAWLGEKGWRNQSSPGEWVVSYHGTTRKNVSGIVARGYDNSLSDRQKYGNGIYSTPDPKVAEGYAEEYKYNGLRYKCILQNRVNFQNTKTIKFNDNATYFLNPNQEDIRPYGICLKKI